MLNINININIYDGNNDYGHEQYHPHFQSGCRHHLKQSTSEGGKICLTLRIISIRKGLKLRLATTFEILIKSCFSCRTLKTTVKP